MRSRFIVFVSICALSLAVAVYAHAILIKSTPAPNEIVAGPKIPVVLTFNSKVDQARSTLTLEAPDHALSKMRVDVDSKSPAKLEATAVTSTSGPYILHWQVLAVDGHITRGSIAFQVR